MAEDKKPIEEVTPEESASTDPRLDPNSKDYDPIYSAAYQIVTERGKFLSTAIDEFINIIDTVEELEKEGEGSGYSKEIKTRIDNLLNDLLSQEKYAPIIRSLEKGHANQQRWEALKPYIEKELKTAKKKEPDKYKVGAPDEITAEDVSCFLYPDTLNPIEENNPFTGLINKAKLKQIQSDLPKTTNKKLEHNIIGIDPLNSKVFGFYGEEAQKIEHFIDTLSAKDRGKNKESVISCIINNPALQNVSYAQQIGHFDEFVHDVGFNLCINNPYHAVSVSSIAKEMCGSNPNSTQLKRVEDSAIRLLTTFVKIDNSIEAETYNYPPIYGAGWGETMWHGVFQEWVINGRRTEKVIVFDRLPILYRFAQAHNNQLISVNPELLNSAPLDNTERSIGIKYFLIRYIKAAYTLDDNGFTKTLLMKNLYNFVNANDNNSRSATRKSANKYLDFLKGKGEIDKYEYADSKRKLVIYPTDVTIEKSENEKNKKLI